MAINLKNIRARVNSLEFFTECFRIPSSEVLYRIHVDVVTGIGKMNETPGFVTNPKTFAAVLM